MWSIHVHTWNNLFVWKFILTDWPCCAIGIANHYRAEFTCYTSQTYPFIWVVCQWLLSSRGVPVPKQSWVVLLSLQRSGTHWFPGSICLQFCQTWHSKRIHRTSFVLKPTCRGCLMNWTVTRALQSYPRSLAEGFFANMFGPFKFPGHAIPHVLRCFADAHALRILYHQTEKFTWWTAAMRREAIEGFFRSKLLLGSWPSLAENYIWNIPEVYPKCFLFVFKLGKTIDWGSHVLNSLALFFWKWGWILLHTLTASNCPGPW